MRRTAMTMATTLTLAGCVAPAVPPPAAPRPVVRQAPIPYGPAGLERVLGKDAAQLTALFGKPDADITEGRGRKLQFASTICVLDAYLYPQGHGAPVVSYVDARQPDGRPIDRASCVGALTRRGGGR